MESYVHRVIGIRTPRGSLDPKQLIHRAQAIIRSDKQKVDFDSIQELKEAYAPSSRIYYTLCAISRRRVFNEKMRNEIIDCLFALRTKIESGLISALNRVNSTVVEREAFRRPFFGRSIKQGVSIRYPLYSCVPTKKCGGRCYAHDGRDRELGLVFRACLNYYIGMKYEMGDSHERNRILRKMDSIIDYGIANALEDRDEAAKTGFLREARIRFSHIGEMVSTPDFANSLAAEIKRRNPTIACIAYTRHPDAWRYNSQLFKINFTLEGDGDNRRRLLPPSARIMCSAWNGITYSEAYVNFLEHHVATAASQMGVGFICPVTANHGEVPSCDSARCNRCFK